jgi:hypothetical protein
VDNWVNDLVEKHSIKKVAAREDLTLPVLERLLNDGYQLVTWDSGRSQHSKCLDLDKQVWTLLDFTSNLLHSAPLAERSHPNDANCTLLVSGEGLPTVRVDYNGNINNA